MNRKQIAVVIVVLILLLGLIFGWLAGLKWYKLFAFRMW
jgi:uncharacterized protein YneF (UPF0154 family)